MTVTPFTLGLVQQAIPHARVTIASMPIKDGYHPGPGKVATFGVSGAHGARLFRTSLDIEALNPGGIAGAVPVTAMFEGQVSWIGKNVALEPLRGDGSVFVTRREGLLLKVHLRSDVGRVTIGELEDPLEYPFPIWVVYEGVTPDPAIDAELERFASADFFDFDSATLAAGAHPQLDDLALSLQANLNLRVALTGYADAEGDAARNLQLGMQRAEAVRAYLRGAGVDDGRIVTDTKGEGLLKLPDAPDRAAAGINRRVEIEIRGDNIGYVQPGADIGTATDSVSITVLDPLGYFLDPLYLVLQLRPDLVNHPLSAWLDPLSPVVASSGVLVVSANPDTDAAADGSAAIRFYDAVDSAVEDAELNDVVWIDLPRSDANLVARQSLSLIGKRQASGALPRLASLTSGDPILALQHVDGEPRSYGLRVLGLEFTGGRAAEGGAVRVRGMENVGVAHCKFRGNFAGPAFNDTTGDGGAIYLRDCAGVVVRSCHFELNSAIRGGAIFAEQCRRLVVTGTAGPGMDAVLFSDAVIDETALPAALTPGAFSSTFVDNMATQAGGALAVKNCSYALRHTLFRGNNVINEGAATYGGAVGTQIEVGEWERPENSIRRCVAIKNQAEFGGGFGVIGAFGDNLAINGNPNSHVGGGQVLVEECVVHGNSGTQMGGGMHVVSGRHRLHRNHFANNDGVRNGGGVSFIGNTRTELVDNRFLRNLVSGSSANLPYTSFPIPPNGVGGGGGAVYASFWIDPASPRVTLRGNRLIANVSRETGGAIRATCGARVTLEGGNLLQDNVAFLHGGGVALNSATLTVGPGNQFVGNATVDGRTSTVTERFRGGHGGAIYCYGGKVAGTPSGDFSFATCASDGAVLAIEGSDADPVLFSGNNSVLKGGAIYVEREDDTSNTVPRRAHTVMRRARFDDNRSAATLSAGGQAYSGSTIVALRLDHPGPALPLAFILEHLRIAIQAGVGLHLVDSSASTVMNDVTYVHLPGGGVVRDEVVE